MFLGILTLITALSISAVAIYYSVAGLMAIFAAAAFPIMIMGGVLEVSKLVTAVWLHRYWKQATWWLKTYLATAVVVLMLITSMGIFGFLSKAHIEQTSASEESIAKVETIQTEIDRQLGILGRAENRIRQLESSETGADANIQSQIDKEQERIDKAFERIQPAIQQQNKIIEDARAADGNRTKPYEDQLASIQAEILRLETSAREYEDKIANLSADTSAVQPLLDQIKNIEEEIIRVTNQLQSSEKAQIRAGQAIIGVTSDGLFGNNTREALAKWVSAQQDRIAQIQSDISQLRKDATSTIDAERTRLAEVVKDIRTVQIPALKDRELTMLGKIDEVRQTESPVIATARAEIQRLRESAERQVEQSQALIKRLQEQLANSDNADQIQNDIDEQQERVRTASSEIDRLTEEKIALEAEYRKLEAEVGPVKYIAEFIYGEEADTNMLEEAVRWVIIIIIFVFDPLAVLLLIASQYTFEFRKRKDDDGGWLRQYEQARAQRIVDNPGYSIDDPKEDTDENSRRETGEEAEKDAETLRTGQDEESIQRETSDDPTLAAEEERKVDDIPPAEDTHSEPGTDGQDSRDGDDSHLQEDNLADNESTVDTVDEEPVPTGETVEEDARLASDSLKGKIEEKADGGMDTNVSSTDSAGAGDNGRDITEGMAVATKKARQLEDTPEQAERRKQYDELDSKEEYKISKNQWKEEHPHETIKLQKRLFIEGKIDKLPWEPEPDEVTSEKQYIQNEEQNDPNSIWKKINR
jgi:hypothetical protein